MRVPCSTSNLGPGFDALGLCLDLFLDVEARTRPRPGPATAEVVDAEPHWPRGEGDLLVRALQRGLARAEGFAVELSVRSQIPIARGLGSSGAAVAAGLLLGSGLAERHGATPLPPRDLLEAAVEFEGHPDNALAALHGGCVLSLRTGAGWRVLPQELHPSIGFAAAWPAAPLPTPLARSVLPATVPFRDAVDNPRRLAALLEGLRTGDRDLLAHGLVDHLHVQHRAPLIRGAREALLAAEEAGAHGATISGSGSTLIALCERAEAPRIADALAEALARHQPVEGWRALEPVAGVPLVHW